MDNESVYKFIEEKYNVTLYPFQRKIIDAILNGQTFSCPRGTGRTMIVNGITEYMQKLHSQHRSIFDADICVGVDEIYNKMFELP